MFKIVLLIFLTFATLQANYTYYRILIGSFSDIKNAEDEILKYKNYLKKNEKYNQLKVKNGFDFFIMHGKKYHTVLIKPFLSKKDARSVLKIINKYKKGSYINSYKSEKLYIANKKEKLNIKQSSPKKNIIKSPEHKEIKKIKETVKEVQPIKKDIKNENMDLVYKMLEFFPYFIIFILLILVYYFYRRNKSLKNKINVLIDESQESALIAKTKDEFLAKLSHEIRTPMNAIIGFSHILLETKLDTQQIRHLNNIQNSADILLGIINDILNFSRIDAGTMKLTKLEFDINNVLDNLSIKITQMTREKGIEFIFDIAKNVPAKMIGDEEKVYDILVNLLSNAVKYTDHGEIVLRLKRLESDKKSIILECKVIDTGIGITKEDCTKLFESFTQADSSDSRKYDGMGLGLAIAKEYISLMNGDISVESTYGKGSTFTFRIELDITQDNDSRSYRLPNKDIMYKKVLVVDNNTSAASSLQRMIAYYHYHADIVESELEAIEVLKEHQYDILCIDSKLLEKSFKNTIQRYKEFTNAKIVLLENDVVRMLDDDLKGIDAELQKPFSQQDIFDTIIELYSDNIEDSKNESSIPTRESLTAFSGMTILLAEDNKINQSVIKNLLKDTGIILEIANNGQEAIESLYKNKNVSMIFMDISMPIMNGYDAAKAIRRDEKFKRIPIVALTANTQPSDIEKSLASGMQEHMGKPFNIPAFYGAIIKYLSRSNKIKAPVAEYKDIIESVRTVEKEDVEEADSMIEKEKGLALVGGDEEMYQELLLEFVDMYKDASSRLDIMIKQEDYELGQKLSHDIKGVSANLGLTKSFEAIRDLETAFKAKNSKEADNKLIIFKHIFEKTREEILA